MPLRTILAKVGEENLPRLYTVGDGLALLTEDVLADMLLFLERTPEVLYDVSLPGKHTVRQLFQHIGRLYDAGTAIVLQPAPEGQLDLETLSLYQLWHQMGYAKDYGYMPFGHGDGLGTGTRFTTQELHEFPCVEWQRLREYVAACGQRFADTVREINPYLCTVGFPPYDHFDNAIHGILVVIEDTTKHFGVALETLACAVEGQQLCNLPEVVRCRTLLKRYTFDPNL